MVGTPRCGVRSAQRADPTNGNSKFGAAGCACEGNHVANVRYAGDKHEHAFEAEAEAGVWHSSIATQIEVPFVIGRIHIVTPHVVLQQFESFFTLAAADDFAD